MKQYHQMTDEERRAFDDSLDFAGDEPMSVTSQLRDGTAYDWDPALCATVETTPTGHRFVVELRDGKLVRVRELPHPAIAI